MPFKPGQSGNPAGRPPQHDKVSLAIRAAALRLSTITPEENLKLMAHDVLRLVYTDPEAPIEARLQCALAALPFEKPRLTATAVLTQPLEGIAARMERAQRRMQGLDVIEGLLDPAGPIEAFDAPQGATLAHVIMSDVDEGGEVLRIEDLI